ncbi:MAG TPA: sigma-70 family RNA polymerase sigma factor [Planctomycetota bacterium]|nr:sigma-70 family RNA polymerase sigma factor [Planctomycetota bacterium]
MSQVVARLYDAHADALFKFILSITGRAADAEDALQELFIRVARNEGRLAAIERPTAYLFEMARNEALRLLGRRREPGIEFVRPTPDSGAEEAEEVNRALADLPREQREVVALHVYAGLTFAEIAERLGEAADTVASRYRYGLQKLKERLRSVVDGELS